MNITNTMTKIMKKIACKVKAMSFIAVIAGAAALLPQLALAADGFAPVDNDLSIIFLQRIFGSAIGSWGAVNATIFGQIFYVFNCGILMIVGLVLFYTVVRSIIEIGQANLGQMANKFNWWQPIRIVGGIGLLVPQATGYSLLNTLVIWITIQGVGLADAVWSRAVNYIAEGGVLYSQPVSPAAPASSQPDVIDLALIDGPGGVAEKIATASDFLRSQICMHYLNDVVEESRLQKLKDVKENPQNYGQADIQRLQSTTPVFREGYDYITGTVRFPGNAEKVLSPPSESVATSKKKTNNLNGVCGAYKWFGVPPLVKPKEGEENPPDQDGPGKYTEAKELSLRYMITPTLTMADEIIKCGAKDTTQCSSGTHEAAYTALVSSVASYQSVIYPMRVYAGNGYRNRTSISAFKPEDLTKDGWIAAGYFYFKLAEINTPGKADSDYYFSTIETAPPRCSPGKADVNGVTQQMCTGGFSDVEKIFNAYLGDSKAQPYVDNLRSRLAWQVDAKANSSVYSLAGALARKLNDRAKKGTAVDLPNILQDFAKHKAGDLTAEVKPDIGGFLQSDEGANAVRTLVKQTAVVGGMDMVGGTIAQFIANPAEIILFAPLNNALSSVFNQWYSLFFGDRNGSEFRLHPILKLQRLGLTMIKECIMCWNNIFIGLRIALLSFWAVNVAATVASAAAAGVSFLGVGTGVQLLMQIFVDIMQQAVHIFVEIPLMIGLPLVFAVAGLLLVNGVTFAYYIPLLPFMLFLFGVIGWLAFVIEGMVASPLVALGVTHPEGHSDLLGKAEQALMLLLGIFIRPAAMIIGLLAAMVLSYVAIDVLNAGFGRVIGMYYGKSGEFMKDYYSLPYQVHELSTYTDDKDHWNVLMQIRELAMILIYTFIVLAIVRQCFALIHSLPGYILQWIGAPHREGTEAQMAKGVEEGLGHAAGKVTDSIRADATLPKMDKITLSKPLPKKPQDQSKVIFDK